MQSVLDKPVSKYFRLDVEKSIYLLILILALVTRLGGLGIRVQSHDESIHTLYSWNLYTGRGYSHHPLMHGPFLFHVTALSYFLFGDNDFSARVPVALMGVAIVLFPYLFRRWLGRKGALVASFFLLISPSIAYYSRYIRHDIPVMLFSLIAVLAMFSYLRDGRKRWLYLMAAGVSLTFATKEVSFIYNAIFGLFLLALFSLRTLDREWVHSKLKAWLPIAFLVLAAGLLFLGASELAAVLAPELVKEADIPLPWELDESTPVSEEVTPSQTAWYIWRVASSKAGLVLSVLGAISSAVLLIAGQLSREHFVSLTPVFQALLLIAIVGLLVLGVDTVLGHLFARSLSTWPDWLASLGRTLIWLVLLVGGFSVLVWHLGRTVQRDSYHFAASILIVTLVAIGVLFRLGLPTLLSYTTCRQSVVVSSVEVDAAARRQYWADLWACGRQSLHQFDVPQTVSGSGSPESDSASGSTGGWPTGGLRLFEQVAFLNGGILIDTRLVLTVLPFLNGLAASFLWLLLKVFRGRRTFDLTILLGTICLPFLSPFLMTLAGLNPLTYTPPVFYHTGAMAIEMFLLSVVIGLMWDLRQKAAGARRYHWLVAALVHYAIFIAFFTTFLTNAYGIASGMVGSLGYWLEQQDVRRGGQPWYYYMVTTSLYEYLPLLLAALSAVYLGVRAWLRPRSKAAWERLSQSAGIGEAFVPFILWWGALSWLGYSVAGEKMPWLTIHLALPMILAGAWLVGLLLERVDWLEVWRKRTWLLALLVPPFVIAIVLFFRSLSAGPFQGYSLTQLQASGEFVNALIGLIVCGIGILYVIRRSGLGLAVRVLLLVALLVPVFVTIRTAWRFCYVNYDYATEFLVYAHGAPGVREAVEQVDEIARRYGGGPYSIEVPYGADGSTFFHWQLRYYSPSYSFGDAPSGDQLDAPVIIAASADWGEVDRYVGDEYITREYTYIWWPMQDYWNLNWDRIAYAIVDPQMRAALWDIWYNRDYTQYDEWKHAHGETSASHTLDNWPLEGTFRLYIRRDVAEQVWDLPLTMPPGSGGDVVSEPYAEGWQDLTARQVFGSTGSELGQISKPRGVKVGHDGVIYVAESGNYRIQKFTPEGEPLEILEQAFLEPWDMALAPDDTLYVADTWNHQIKRLGADGDLMVAWGTLGQHAGLEQTGPGEFYGPRGVAIGPGGRVYVADTGNKRVQVFEPSGQYAFMWGGGGALSGYLDEPVGIAIGPEGNVYVADTWNRRVQVFTSSGVYLREWPIDGWDSSQPEVAAEEKPYLAVDGNGYVYVTDPGNFRVLVFDSEGNYELSFGKYGLDKSSFTLPTGIDVADDGTIYVGDAHSDRVLVFDPLDLEGEPERSEPAVPKLKFPPAGSVLSDGALTFVGTGPLDSKVQVLIDERAIGVADVDSDGVWTLTSDELDESGTFTVTLHALVWMEDLEHYIPLVTSEPVQLIVEEEPVPPVLDLDPGADYFPGSVTLGGTGEIGVDVRVLIDERAVGSTTVDRDGYWSLIVELGEPGDYVVIVQALDADGQVVAASEPKTLTLSLPSNP